MKNKSMPDSNTWLQEFTPYVGGKRVRWADIVLTLVEGETCTLMLDYEYSWLIGLLESVVSLEFKPGSETQGLVFDPPLGQPLEMAEGTTSISWTISTTGAPGSTFVLQFSMPEFKEMPKSPPVPGKIVTIENQVKVSFDELAVVLGKSSLYPCLGARHVVAFLPTADSELRGKDVTLKIITPSGAAPDVVFRPGAGTPQRMRLGGVSWELDYTQSKKNEEFSLQLVVAAWTKESLPLSVSSGHNLVTVERWFSNSNVSGWPPLPQVGIRASSEYLKVPVAGVEVSISSSSGTSHGYTDKDGKYVASGEGIGLSVFNKYDGSWV